MSKGPAIPEPRPDLYTLTEAARATKEAVEVLSRDRGDILDGAVTFRDLLTLGLIGESDLAQIRLRDRKG